VAAGSNEVLLQRIAAYGLDQDQQAGLPEEPLNADRWLTFAFDSFEQKLTGLVLDAIQDGGFAATPDQADHTAGMLRLWHERTEIVDAGLLDAHRLLAGRGVDHRVVKGPATATRLYDDALLRPYSDADVVVPLAEFGRAMSELQNAGWRRHEPEHRAHFAERFAQAVALWNGSSELDLHRMLVHPPAGDVLPSDIAFQLDGAAFELRGQPLPALEDADALVHSAAHALFDHVGAMPLLAARDLVLWNRRVSAQDRDERARAWGLGLLPAHALAAALSNLGIRDTAPRVELGPDERRLLDLHERDVRFGRVRTLPTVRSKLQYSWGMFVPSKSYLDYMGQTRWSRLGVLLRPLSRRRAS
jgi:hypothetical protein